MPRCCLHCLSTHCLSTLCPAPVLAPVTFGQEGPPPLLLSVHVPQPLSVHALHLQLCWAPTREGSSALLSFAPGAEDAAVEGASVEPCDVATALLGLFQVCPRHTLLSALLGACSSRQRGKGQGIPTPCPEGPLAPLVLCRAWGCLVLWSPLWGRRGALFWGSTNLRVGTLVPL